MPRPVSRTRKRAAPGSAGPFRSPTTGRYIIRYRLPNGRLITGSGKTLAGARENLARLIVKRTAEAQEEIHPRSSSSRESGLHSGSRLDDYLRYWLTEVLPSKDTVNSQKTRDLYSSHLRLHAIPMLGHLVLADITPEDIEDWQRQLGTRMSAKGVHGARTALSSAMTDARRARLIRFHPVRDSKGPSQKAKRFPNARPIFVDGDPVGVQEELAEERAGDSVLPRWSADQIRTFLAARFDDPEYALWVTAIGLGLRRGELIGLFFSDIDWRNQTLTIDRQLLVSEMRPPKEGGSRRRVSAWVAGPLKSSASYRTLDIPDNVLEVLRQRYERRKPGTTIIFGNPRRVKRGSPDFIDAPMHPDTVGRLWHKAIAEVNGTLTDKLPDMRFHGTRHTCASQILAMSNGNLYLVKSILGHGSIAVTIDLYGGWATASSKALMTPLNELFDGLVPPRSKVTS